MSLPPLKTTNQVRQELRTWMQEMDLEITREFDTPDTCGFWVKSGDFPLLIENRKPLKYCVIAFQITFSDAAITRTVNDYYHRQDNRFIYRLTRALTTSQTSFVRVMEGGEVSGFTILRYLYPFHEGFSIRDLDSAVQAVVSAGDIGIAFLRAEMGPIALDHTPARPTVGPESLYE